MRITHNRLRRLIQGVALAAFAWVALLMPWLAGAETVGCWGRWFLQLDPVVSLSAALASRTWSVAVIPAAICLLICFVRWER